MYIMLYIVNLHVEFYDALAASSRSWRRHQVYCSSSVR